METNLKQTNYLYISNYLPRFRPARAATAPSCTMMHEACRQMCYPVRQNGSVNTQRSLTTMLQYFSLGCRVSVVALSLPYPALKRCALFSSLIHVLSTIAYRLVCNLCVLGRCHPIGDSCFLCKRLKASLQRQRPYPSSICLLCAPEFTPRIFPLLLCARTTSRPSSMV